MIQILTASKVDQKIQRLAIEIWERHYNDSTVILAGINNNGYHFAGLIRNAMESINGPDIQLTHLKLSPADPVSAPITIDLSPEELKDRSIIIVDDVANTGRTLFYACKCLMEVLPKQVEVAALVDRTHKHWPIKVDYVGLSLATTIQDHIVVDLKSDDSRGVYLR